MQKRNHSPHRTFDIARIVLSGVGYRRASVIFSMDDENLRLTVQRFCRNVNPYLYDDLRGDSRYCSIELLRRFSSEFMPCLDSSFDVENWLEQQKVLSARVM